MTNRDLTAPQIQRNNSQSVIYHELLYIRTRDSGSVNYDYTYLTNAPYDIQVTAAQAVAMRIDSTVDTNFLAVGPFLSFSNIEESADFQITTMTVSLSGMRGEDLALFLENQYIDQPLMIWRVWLDDRGVMVGNPVQIFSGQIDRPVIRDDPQGQVVIGCTAASQWVDYQRTAGRRTNNNEQQFLDTRYYGGTTANIDIGFKFAGDAITNLKWGG